MTISLRGLVPLLAAAFLFTTDPGFAGETYTWGHPRPQGNAVHNMAFVDADTGWAVAGDATVLTTTDGGQSWQLIHGPYPDGAELNDLTVLSGGDLLAVGQGIFRSSDGGITWTAIASPAAGELYDLTDIPGGSLSATGEAGAVIVSFDGGVTWTDVGPGTGSGKHHLWRSVDEGYVVGDEISHRTIDGGTTWTQMTDFPLFQFNEIYFRDDLHAVIVEDFSTWHSDDGGITWTEIFNPSPPTYRYRTLVLTPDHLLTVCFGEGGEFWESLDGGQTWTEHQIQAGEGFPCLYRTISGRLLWGSDAGDLYWSDDLGQTIHNATAKLTDSIIAPFDHVLVRPDGVLFAADAPSHAAEEESWLRSDDDGQTWTEPAGNPGLRGIDDSAFLDNDTGLAISGNIISLTADGGDTWSQVVLDANRRLSRLALPAADRFFVTTGLTTGGGDLLLSTDGGLTWNAVSGGLPTGNFQGGAVFFLDETTGFVSGFASSTPRLYRTTDGGQTWTQMTASGLDAAITDFQFVSATEGLVTTYQGSNPGIYRTTDGGATFTLVYEQRLYRLVFRDASAGFATGYRSQQCPRTTDGGLTWTAFPAPFSGPGGGDHYGRLHVVAPTAEGWLFGGDSGRLLTMRDDSILSPVEPVANARKAGTCRLLDAAPNPFNPLTRISYEIDHTGPVRVAVFDLAGRHVRTLVHGDRAAGRHEVTWDGAAADGRVQAAGIYLVRVTTPGGADHRKVSLVK